MLKVNFGWKILDDVEIWGIVSNDKSVLLFYLDIILLVWLLILNGFYILLKFIFFDRRINGECSENCLFDYCFFGDVFELLKRKWMDEEMEMLFVKGVCFFGNLDFLDSKCGKW